MKLPPLASLRCFVVASKSENFSAAADSLCVTPSAVSHQIKMLEKMLQRPLFVRVQHRMELRPRAGSMPRSWRRYFSIWPM